MYKFEYPEVLFLLFLLLPLIAWYVYKLSRTQEALQISTAVGFAKAKKGLRYYLQHLPFALTCLALAAIIIATARPRSSSEFETVDSEGIDIMLVLDISTSMLARDFKPDRIEAAKEIAIQFISERKSDRMGLVVFAGESFTQCPLTTDKVSLINMLKEIKLGMIEDMTAIGNGLATAVSRLKDSKATSRVIILLTDGVNNTGEISPEMAAEMAMENDLRIYSIGIGTQGMAPYPVQTPYGIQLQNMKVELDEALLESISSKSGGKYFRATDNNKMYEIYNEINELEKTKTQVESYVVYKEEFIPFAIIGLALLLLGVLLGLFVLKILP